MSLDEFSRHLNSKYQCFCRDVVSGIAHLHELGIIHRDLKPQNVLINNYKDIFLSAKLSDMGISKRLPGDSSSITQHATGRLLKRSELLLKLVTIF